MKRKEINFSEIKKPTSKDFIKWLKEDDLYEYVRQNPIYLKEIYRDFLHEWEYPFIHPDNLENWINWMSKNIDEAFILYPYHTNLLVKMLDSSFLLNNGL